MIKCVFWMVRKWNLFQVWTFSNEFWILWATHHTESCSNFLQGPADIINRKRPFSVCFPYNAVQYLWCKIDELIRSGHMVDACEKLRNLLHGALLNHMKLVYCTLMLDSCYVQLSCQYALHFLFPLFFLSLFF